MVELKMGKIENIGNDKITILNIDGPCYDTLTIDPEEAIYIKDEISRGEEVIYFAENESLVHIDLKRNAPELQELYEALPKKTECVSSN
jgi:hypothetical protein